jgi:hypothetical protein
MSENVYDDQHQRQLSHEDCPYLEVSEWEVVGKLYRVLGGTATNRLLQQSPEKVRETPGL